MTSQYLLVLLHAPLYFEKSDAMQISMDCGREDETGAMLRRSSFPYFHNALFIIAVVCCSCGARTHAQNRYAVVVVTILAFFSFLISCPFPCCLSFAIPIVRCPVNQIIRPYKE